MKTILVALDASPRASDVLAAAVDQARAFGAKLILLRAVGLPVDLPHAALAMAPANILDDLLQRARAELSGVAKTVPADVTCETKVEPGTAWQTICEVAKEANVDLIVIGSHGYGALDRLLGTTSARVVNHAERPVLVVRSAGEEKTQRKP
jgi:universal stress protein F